MIISIHGCMAVGKTTTVLAIKRKLGNRIDISLEDNKSIMSVIKTEGYDKMTIDGFCSIQRLFIMNEIERYNKYKNKNAIFDSGLEATEFYTLFSPKANGMLFDAEKLLHRELELLRRCKSDHMFFLLLDIDKIIQHKNNDKTRSRASFDFHISNMLDDKINWFKRFSNVSFVNCNDMAPENIADEICRILKEKGMIF